MCSVSRSSFGTGGMLSKLRSAKMATTAGIDVHIINGLKTENLSQLLSGEKVGTWFPRIGEDSLSDKKLWLLLGSTSNGQIIVDDGVTEALKQKKDKESIRRRLPREVVHSDNITLL